MARPLKVGIDYFPTDVDIDQDDKVKMVKNKYGLMGIGTVLMLLAKVYKNGYYYHWTEREQELFSGDYREEVNSVNNVVNECIKWGLFDKNVFDEHQVLTSSGIQKRYLLAVERRKDKHIIDEYWLLEKEVNDDKKEVNVNNNSVNADKKPVNASKSTQSKVNKTKVNEIKENKRKKKPTLPKIMFAEFVFLTEDEHNKLLEKFNIEQTARMIEILDNYKGSSGKKYDSDYRAILNWVVKRYEEEKERGETRGKYEGRSQTSGHGRNKKENEFAFLDVNKPGKPVEYDPTIF